MAATSPARQRIQWAGLAAGPLLAALGYLLLPDQYGAAGGEALTLGHGGRATLAVMIWMAVWWLTEAIDIAATALLPIALLPIVGAATIGQATAPYANEFIFLFLGGFLLALAMQRWGLDRRIALITLRFVGTRPANMVAGIMFATALLSMFVSNTATAAMMLPIALSVVVLVESGTPDNSRGNNFAVCMMLGIAYAASIGGVATKIGTPPNVILLAFVKDTYGISIDFLDWFKVGLPLVVVFGPLSWLLLTRVLYPVERRSIEGAGQIITEQYASLGAVKRAEWATFAVFTITALCWIFRPIISEGLASAGDSGGYLIPPLLPGLDDSGIAIIGALLLFVIPVSRRERTFVLDWETAKRLPWGILILFGGGLSLAAAVKANGVAEFIGHATTSFAGGGAVPSILIVLAVTTMVIFLTELTSNTATTAALVPILAALAPGLDIHPFMLIVPATIAASCAFMMPVATPPNAIVFGSGYLTIPQMCRAGIWLNLIGVVLVTALAYAVIGPLLAH